MFSSLPSASKIYLSSVKPRQKTLNSAKKKRKNSAKSAVGVCSPVRVLDEETLVSTISLRKSSESQLSVNSESDIFDELVIDKRDSESPIAEAENDTKYEENLQNIENISSHRGSLSTDKETNSENASDKSQHSESEGDDSTAIESIAQTKETDEVTDSIYCDKSVETDNHADNGMHMLSKSSNNLKHVNEISPTKLSRVENGECDIHKNVIECNHEEVSSSLPEMQVTTEDSDSSHSSKEEENSKDHTSIRKSIDSKDQPCSHKNLISGSLISKSETSEQNCTKNEVSCESTSGLKVDKISPDTDCSSDRSDYCTSTDIYDVHIVNSEHSSTDENGEECRLHSPEQSEVSCTESIMFDNKCSCQNESIHPRFSDLQEESAEESLKKPPLPIDETNSNVHSISEKALDISSSLVNFHRVLPDKMLKRSMSLPENICDSKFLKKLSVPYSKQTLDVQNKNFSKCIAISNPFFYSSDKSTNTTNESYSMSSKSTITSDIISQTNSKKDVATTPIKSGNYETVTENKDVTKTLKENNILIMKVLPTVGVMQARARSYVFGSIGSTGSLLGNEELSRFFPDYKVTVFVGTWNMNGHNPPECLDDFLLPLDISSVPDIYAIGVQESMQSRSEWEILLQTTLGPSHVLFASTSFGVLHLSIFMRRDLIWFCSEPEEANIATRPGSMIKTKGAVAICFVFFGTSFLFVNSHLTAHEQKLKERLSDYEKICSSLDLPRQIPLKPHQRGKDVTSRFDCVFWCGDLNFRVVQDRPSVLSFVEEKIRAQSSSCNSLMKHDQLTQAMAKGVAFHGFNEGVINFIPSYKFDVGTSCFDSAKERVPSYTDRILYRSRDKSSVVCLHYDAVPEIFTSDHKPVFAVFKVSIKPGRDNIPLAAGLFKRDIYLEAVKRRAQQLKITGNHKQSTICNIM